MIEKTVGNIHISKFQLRYQIEGTGIPAIVIGSSIYYKIDIPIA